MQVLDSSGGHIGADWRQHAHPAAGSGKAKEELAERPRLPQSVDDHREDRKPRFVSQDPESCLTEPADRTVEGALSLREDQRRSVPLGQAAGVII